MIILRDTDLAQANAAQEPFVSVGNWPTAGAHQRLLIGNPCAMSTLDNVDTEP